MHAAIIHIFCPLSFVVVVVVVVVNKKAMLERGPEENRPPIIEAFQNRTIATKVARISSQPGP